MKPGLALESLRRLNKSLNWSAKPVRIDAPSPTLFRSLVSMLESSHVPDARNGFIAGLLAYTMWGVFPIYIKIVQYVAPTEVLMHRVIWAVPFGALILLFRGQFGAVRNAMGDRSTMLWLLLSAICITGNWFVYIWSVQNGYIFQASLGYYINPLVYVLAGVILFGERLRPLQITAVLLAGIGVLYMVLRGEGFPWMAIALAILFAAYGIIRKQVQVGAMPGLFLETVMLLPLASMWLAVLYLAGDATFASGDLAMDGWLLLAGPFTVLPLLFFATAARNLSLTSLGFMQFIAPTVQFFVGLYYGETLTLAYMVCFVCIWLAVTIFSFDAVRAGRKKPRAVMPTRA